jgi:hypothetical protein
MIIGYKVLLLSCVFLFKNCHLQAQNKHSDNGYLIYTLGRDTTTIGHYQLNGDDFEMTVLEKPGVEVHKLKGSFFPSGECKYVEGYAYKPIIGKDSLILQTYKLFTRNDSTFTEQKIGSNESIFGYSGKGMIHLGISPYIFFTPLYANYAPAKSGDSKLSSHFIYGTKNPFTIKRINKNTVTVGSTMMGVFTVYFNKMGKPSYIDAIGSSFNVKGRILPYLNMDSTIHVEALREQHMGVIPDLNKPDSVQATISSTVIKLSYSRPSTRGRVIFGEVVPWNRFWRTGANAATKISLSAPIYFNNKELPAGEYSIFTMPAKKGWTMMFNKEANIWGTRYNPANDVLRVRMQAEQLKGPVELMTIEIVALNDGGAINVIWEKTKASVAFRTKK